MQTMLRMMLMPSNFILEGETNLRV
jgi:hypothetical protein